jgi:hypothetical protein
MAQLARVRLLQDSVQIWDWLYQRDGYLPEPFGEIVALVFLPLMGAVDKQNLMKLG